MADRFVLLYTGPRLLTDRAAVWRDLDEILARHPSLLLRHGACRKGGDLFAAGWQAERAADGCDVLADPIAAPWHLGKIAGPMRNGFMAGKGADGCLAHIRPGSTGSGGCAAFAEWAGITTWRRHAG